MLFGMVPNLRILDYLEACNRLNTTPYVADYALVERIDADRFAGFADAITVEAARIRRLDIWHASDSLLARHPYIGARGARSLVRYRDLYDSTRWTLPDLASERVLSLGNIEKLKKYIEIQ